MTNTDGTIMVYSTTKVDVMQK